MEKRWGVTYAIGNRKIKEKTIAASIKALIFISRS